MDNELRFTLTDAGTAAATGNAIAAGMGAATSATEAFANSARQMASAGASAAEIAGVLGGTAKSLSAILATEASALEKVAAAFQAQLNPTTALGEKLTLLEKAGFSATQIFAVFNRQIQQTSATALANQQAIHPLVGTYLGMATALQTAADAAMRLNATLAQTSSLGGLAQTEAIRRATLGQAGVLGGIPINATNIPAINATTQALMDQAAAQKVATAAIAAGAPVITQQTGLLASMGITMGHVKNMAMGLLVYRVIWGSIEAVTGAIKGTIDSAIDFEKAFAQVKRTVGGTAPEMAQLRSEILSLSLAIPVTAIELSKIASYAGQLGIETPNIIKFTEVMARLAASSNLSMEEAATGMAKFMQIMGTPQGEVDKLASIVVKLGVNTAATEGEIMKMAFRLAGAGNMAGLTEAQVLALSSTLGSLGMRADLGGSAISKTFRDIARAVGSDLEKLTGFATVAGISAQKFANIFKRDAAEALLLFLEGLSKYKGDAPEMIALLDELGIKQSRQVDAILRAGGAVEEFRKQQQMANKESIDNAALQESSKTAWETTRDEITKTGNSWYALGAKMEWVLTLTTLLAKATRAPAGSEFEYGKDYGTLAKSLSKRDNRMFGPGLEEAMRKEAEKLSALRAPAESWHPPMALTEVMDAVLPKANAAIDKHTEKIITLDEVWRKGIRAIEDYYASLTGIANKVFPNAKEMQLPEPKNAWVPMLDAINKMKPGLMDIKETELQRYVKSFTEGRRSLEGQLAPARALLDIGQDLDYVYEKLGSTIEKYPEYFTKAQWSAAMMGRMAETIKSGWMGIGTAIENVMGHKTFKSYFDSILSAWKSLIGDMISTWIHSFLRPILSNLANSMGAMFGRAGFGAVMGGGSATAGAGVAQMLDQLGISGGSGASGSGTAKSSTGGSAGIWGGGRAGNIAGGLGSMAASMGGTSLFQSSLNSYGWGGFAKTWGGGIMAGAGIGGMIGGPPGALVGAIIGSMVGQITGIVKAIMGRPPGQSGAMESQRDFGVNISSSTFEQFATGLGLNSKQYGGIRKDISSSPKFLTEVLFPQAKASGSTEAFLRSLESVTTAWGTFNFRSAFETWMKTGDSTALNKAFIAAFSVSQRLQEVLPDWQQQLMAAGDKSKGANASRVGIHFNPTVTGPTYRPVTTPTQRDAPVTVNITVEGYYDSAGAKKLFENEIGPELLNQLQMNSPVRGRSVNFKSAMREAMS